MTITRVGTNNAYADGWENAFGGKKRKSGNNGNSKVPAAKATKSAPATKQAAATKVEKKVVAAKELPTATKKKPAPKKAAPKKAATKKPATKKAVAKSKK